MSEQPRLAVHNQGQDISDVAQPAHAFMDLVRAHDPEGRLADPQYRADLIIHATPADALTATRVMNTTLYGEEKALFNQPIVLNTGEGDGRKVRFVGLAPEDGPEVFTHAFTKGQELVRAQGAEALEPFAVIMANTIVGTQMFEDGNKRTARAVATITTEGFDGSDAAVARYENLLSETMEARNAILFLPFDTGHIRSFVMEGRPDTENAARMAFENAWFNEHPAKGEFNALLTGIDDEMVRSACVNVLQQDVFGSTEITRLLGRMPEVALHNRESISLIITEVKERLSRLTIDEARDIISRDHATKKAFMLRMIDSTTGERPLPVIDYVGRVRTDTVAWQ